MSEFFLELFSEEIPAGLQKNLRDKILNDFKNLFDEKSIKSKKNFSISCPNRVAIVFEGLDKSILIKAEEIRGPKVEAPEQALEGFIRSNKIERRDLYKKKTEKGEFYFYKIKSKSLKTHDLLIDFIPKILDKENILHYACSNYRDPKSEVSIKWNDADLKINWGVKNPIISKKDKLAINLKDFKKKRK